MIVISFSWDSSLVVSGLMFASVNEEVVFVKVTPKYVMPFLLHVYGSVFCSMS